MRLAEVMMAKPLREYTDEIRPTRKGDVLPMARASEQPTHLGVGAIAAVKSYLDGVQREAVTSYEAVEKRLRILQRRSLENVKRIREERPLQLLAAIMGIAFATGLAFRLWRSSHNE